MKKLLLLTLAASLTLATGCSVGNIDISKNEVETEPTRRQPQQITEDGSDPSNTDTSDNAAEPLEIPYSEVPETAALGEKFCVIGPVNSGHLYLTINKCEVFNSLNDAGMEFDDLMHVLIGDGFNYDAKTTEFLKEFKMVKIYMTMENVDAVSRDHVWKPDLYDKYDFSVGRMGSIRYATGEYFDLHPEDENKHYQTLHLEPGESKDIIMGYLLDTRQCALEDAVFSNGDEINTPEDVPYTVVDLKLGG